MWFRVLKNTVFPITIGIVLVLISCANTSKTGDDRFNTTGDRTKSQDPSTNNHQPTAISVGANQTESYLPLLKGKRVGILANQTSVIFKTNGKNYTHLVDSLLALNVKISKVFSPEHGFRGNADAGEHVNNSVDAKTGLSIVSLHGDLRKPKPEHLTD